MKKSTTLITLLLLCVVSIFAQAPEKFTYQAVVRNASNALVVNTQVGVRVNILQGSATGNAVYSESHMATTNANGLITVNIGGSVLHVTFADIDWSDGPYFLKTDLDPNGGNDYTITSVQQLLSVPYALYAKDAGNGFSGDYNDLVNVPQIPQIPADISAFNNDAGYITGYTETDPQYNAWDKDYNDLINKPAIPTAVGELTNNMGYITLAQVPAQMNADWNATTGAAQILNKPTIPTVPTNVSAFTNDAGYITSAAIPTVPTNVSAFNNDAGYITSTDIPAIPTVPANVSTFENDAHYITEAQLNALLAAMINTIDSLRDRIEELENNPSQPIPAQTLGSVTTSTMTYVGVNSAIGGGNVTSDGNGSILARGICWSTSNPPYITDSHTNEGTAVGVFSSTASGLNPSTTYYVRAYAINQVGQAYSEQMVVTTLANTKPTVATLSASGLGKCIGNIVSTGGLAITDRGFCYSTYPNPTIVESHISAGAGDGQFSSMLPDMVDGTTYFVRAYATNMLGTSYGQQISFTYGCGNSFTVTDYDGNTCNTVRLGNQCWMKENLRSTHYSDGTAIAYGGTTTSTTEAYYYAPNGSFTYGYLYNWKAVMRNSSSSQANPSGVQGICPIG